MRGLWQYFAPVGWATQWYWPEGVHGRLWNGLRGHDGESGREAEAEARGGR